MNSIAWLLFDAGDAVDAGVAVFFPLAKTTNNDR